jgi:ribosome-binding protein aMBF1 (putative translation factor)
LNGTHIDGIRQGAYTHFVRFAVFFSRSVSGRDTVVGRKAKMKWAEMMGKQFARARKAKDLTQAQLARRAKVPLRSLQEWEQGTRIPRLDRVIQLADALAITLDEFVGRGEPEQPSKRKEK